MVCIVNLALQKYEEVLKETLEHMSFSKNIVNVSDDLLESIQCDREAWGMLQDVWRNEKEPYRIKTTYMIEKVHNTGNPNVPSKHRNTTVLKSLLVICKSSRQLAYHFADYVADKYIKKLIRQVELFGFHLAALDIRQHSKEHENAMTEILAKMGITSDYRAVGRRENRIAYGCAE